MGASVLHEEAVFPARRAGIPINIRNTNQPDDPGTMILADRDVGDQVVTGIAGKAGFTALHRKGSDECRTWLWSPGA